MRIVSVTWETDGEKVSLPDRVQVPAAVDDDSVADYLSDEYGWLVSGWVEDPYAKAVILSQGELFALVNRDDLLASECEIKLERGLNWFGMAKLREGHTSGGSTLDRQNVSNAMHKLENASRCR